MKLSYSVLMIACAAISLQGQNTFSGPVSGYVFDTASNSIRAVQGVPGAASLMAAVGPSWDFVSVAPNGTRALASSGLSLSLIPDLSQPASSQVIAQIPGGVSRIAWSTDSSTAAVWAQAAGLLQRITNLDSTPAIHAPVDLTVLAGVLSGWAIGPDGRYLALSSAGTNTIYLSDQDAAPAGIGTISEPGAIAFSPDGSSLFVFDGARDQVDVLSLPSGAVTGNLDAASFSAREMNHRAAAGRDAELAARRPTADGVRDLAPSADGTRLYAIGGANLCSWDLTTWQIQSCSNLNVSPTSFQAMPGGIFLLNYARSTGMPLWVLDGKAGKLYFIPTGNAADASL